MGTLDAWLALPLSAWTETCDTLHLWTQVVGKVKLARSPFLNELWQVALTLTPRGLTTGTMPDRDRSFAIDFDFLAHELVIAVSDGQRRVLPLVPRSIAEFHREVLSALRTVGIQVQISPRAVEMPDPVPFDRDHRHRSYDPDWARRWWRIQLRVESVLQRFRSDFVGKSSPVSFFWGSFDLTTTRFSGRPATPPEGAPSFVRLAEDQENHAVGFWPGNATMTGVTLGEPAFYAYVYPEPPGFRDARIGDGRWEPSLGEFVLPYEAMRRTKDPDETLLAFCRRTYEAGASLGRWERDRLERVSYPSAAAT